MTDLLEQYLFWHALLTMGSVSYDLLSYDHRLTRPKRVRKKRFSFWVG